MKDFIQTYQRDISLFERKYSLLIFVMECIELNSKYMKKFRSTQPCVSTNSCTELSKTLFFPVSIDNSNATNSDGQRLRRCGNFYYEI